MVSPGFEVDPQALRAARTSYQAQALVVQDIASRFEAAAHLDPDVFGNLPESWQYAPTRGKHVATRSGRV